MDLSMLLSQAQMSYSKMNFSKSSKSTNKNNNQELMVSVFEQNLDLILSFLCFEETQNLRLLCRGVGYLFIVRDLWTGIKINVADKKLQDIDDYEFVEEQPKQISKQDKKIRIHSLKKNIALSLSKKPKRQASNIKAKKTSMAVIQNQLNPFQKTQIGFKRLLKSTNPSIIKTNSKIQLKKNIDIQQNMSIQRLPQLLQIPGDCSIDDLIINPKDQWVKNMHRANNLITVVKKWNAFVQRFGNYISKQENQLLSLMKKIIRIDGCLLAYKTTLQEQPHSTIISIIEEYAPKNALIEQQLNRLGKQFIENHKYMTQMIVKKQTQQIITALHQCFQKISQKLNKPALQAGIWAQGLTIIDQAYDNIVSKISIQKLKVALIKSIANVFKQLVENHLTKEVIFNQNQKFNLREINIKFVIQNAQFCQFIFQVLYNIFGKLGNSSAQSQNQESNISGGLSSTKFKEQGFIKKLKPVQKLSESKLLSSTLTYKFKSTSLPSQYRHQKTLFGILWNISKYFDKLQKQLALKQKKKKQQSKVHLIKMFLDNQSQVFGEQITLTGVETNEQSFTQGLIKIEEYYKQFKVKIQRLKEQMRKTQN